MPSSRALAVIMRAKFCFRAAEYSASAVGGVVGRLGDQRIDRGFDGDRSAGLDAELGRRLRGGLRGERHRRRLLDLAARERLEDQVERHHLGQRSRIARARRHLPRTASCRCWRRPRSPHISRWPPMPPATAAQRQWPARRSATSARSQGRDCTAETMPTPDALLHPLNFLMHPEAAKVPASHIGVKLGEQRYQSVYGNRRSFIFFAGA